MNIYYNIYIPNLFSPFNAICMHIFRTDYFALDNESVGSFLQKTTTLTTPSFPWFPVVLLIGLRPHGLSPHRLILGMHVGETLWV